MDLSFSEEQEMLWKSARDFLVTKCPKTLVRQMEEDEKGYVPELWKEMADLGWVGLPFAEKYGGGGFKFLDLVILIEEMGRACLPGPFLSTVVLGGMPVAEWGTEEQKKAILPKLCKGELVMTMALTEPVGRYEAKAVQVKAVAEGDSYVINGTKLFVNDGNVADKMIVAARTAEKSDPEKGITLFIVDRKSPGISTVVLRTIAGDKQCEVTFNKVKVPKANVLGKVDEGWPMVKKVMEWAALAKSAEMMGGAQQVLEMTIQYAKDRVQFDRPIGSFQIIQHYLADMSIDVDSSRVSLHKAAWMLSEGMPCRKEIAVIKGWLSEAYRRVAAQAHQIHGAIGFTKDHDLELYFRRAKAGELYFGDADFHREVVAQELGM
ncbi:MAG: acyl-CoA/acyl-ACP dehydrogenase [Chloroflexi bacterium]|nr:acyl-CoA/acyl-ACP dehydrogenase [Chloroflexota bacterium]